MNYIQREIVRSLIRGMAYRVAWQTPFWIAVAILIVLFVFGGAVL